MDTGTAAHRTDGVGNADRPAHDGRDPSFGAADAVRERADALWDDAKTTARSKLNEQKDVAAEGLDGVAGALRDAAQRRESEGERDTYAQLSGSAADGLERLSRSLRSKDVGTMLRDMETFAAGQPVAFFGLALAAGFIGARFIKASRPAPAHT